MEVILISISLLLHVVAFYLIFYLIKQVQLLREDKLEGIQQLFSNYLVEIKEENDRLQKQLSSNSLINERPQVATLEEDQLHKTTLNDQHKTNPIKHTDTPEIPLTQRTDHIQDTYEPSLQANILQMHDQGYTEEEIAKTLNCGKTEVELIVKFHHQK